MKVVGKVTKSNREKNENIREKSKNTRENGAEPNRGRTFRGSDKPISNKPINTMKVQDIIQMKINL